MQQVRGRERRDVSMGEGKGILTKFRDEKRMSNRMMMLLLMRNGKRQVCETSVYGEKGENEGRN